MTDREVMQMALEALDGFAYHGRSEIWTEAVTALRARLAEPEPEPVALDWLHKWANQDDGEPEAQWHEGYEAARRVVQIHLTAPPQRRPVVDPAEYDDAGAAERYNRGLK